MARIMRLNVEVVRARRGLRAKRWTHRRPVGYGYCIGKSFVSGDPTETVSESSGPLLDGSDDDGAPRLLVIIECRRLTAGALRLSLANLDAVTLGRDASRHVLRHGRSA